MSKRISFESEHNAFAYLFTGLITLCAFPVLAWHYVTTLEGFAVLAIGGLLCTDAVMWFAAHWSVKTRSASMRAVSLVVKFLIAGVAVTVAGVVILIMRGDYQTDRLIKQQTQARKAEIEARTAAAAQLAQVQGGRMAAREAMKIDAGKDAGVLASESRADLEAKIPAWFLDIGVYTIPPLAAILGALALTITATIIKRREAEEEIQAETRPAVYASHQAQGQAKPVQVWRGGMVVETGKDVRPN